MRGTIVIGDEAGRALRQKRVAVFAACVLDSAGSFRAGDRVYVSFRGRDGGQYVVATGIVRCDDAVLQQIRGRSAAIRGDVGEDDAADVVIRDQDLKLLWPSAGGMD